MPALLIRCRVENPRLWRPVVADWAELLHASGARALRAFARSDHRQEIFALWDWDTIDRAWLFVQSDELLDLLVQAGALDRPEITVLEDLDAHPVV